MDLGAIAAIVYGVLAIVGGGIGFRQAGSKMSLGSGIVSGALLLCGGIAQHQGLSWGLLLSVIVTLVLILVFCVRFFKTRKFMPAGLMILAGAIALAGMLLRFT